MPRTILITGGTGALGRAVVQRFVEAGETVHVPWIAQGEVRELEALLGASSRRVQLHGRNVTLEKDVGELFAAISAAGGRVEVLVNLVGGFAYAPIEETDAATWDRMLQLNLAGTFLCARAAVPGMKSARWGRIINVSSAPALNHGAANMSAYAAAKAAVLNLSESLAKELSSHGITVNALVPSVIDTAANRAAEPGADTSKWLKPSEIAEVVWFLASDQAGIVTGSAVNLSRG
jgi:NAD(P)-dependent dehydrogenase (short-subunit alcohol dehydrogenase family)